MRSPRLAYGVVAAILAVRSIARAHGGDVRVAPQAGPGARFELTLPEVH